MKSSLKTIATHCNAITDMEKLISAGGTTHSGGKIHVGPSELYGAKHLQIGGLCSLLDVLKDMVVPAEKLDWVIEELKKLTYPHAVISGTIRDLTERTK